MLFLLQTLIACSGSAEDTGASTLPDPAWGAEEAEAQLELLLQTGLPDPDSLLQTYLDLFSGADPRCPFHDNYSMVGAFDGCTSDLGYLFAGVSTYEATDAGFWLLGDCYILDDQGREFLCAGELSREESDGLTRLSLTGTWGYEGSATPWIAALPSMALWVEHEGDRTSLDGSYGLGEAYTYASGLRVERGCASGELWLRDPNGGWFTLSLDQSCDGCGSLSYGDQKSDDICIPLSAAVDDLLARLP